MQRLRFTTTNPSSMFVFDLTLLSEPIIDVDALEIGDLVNMDKIKGVRKGYIHGKAEYAAGFDIPLFLDGDFMQLDCPVEQQDIVMILKDGEHKVHAHYDEENEQYLFIYPGDEISLPSID